MNFWLVVEAVVHKLSTTCLVSEYDNMDAMHGDVCVHQFSDRVNLLTHEMFHI
jgi:hypothetical protein